MVIIPGLTELSGMDHFMLKCFSHAVYTPLKSRGTDCHCPSLLRIRSKDTEKTGPTVYLPYRYPSSSDEVHHYLKIA